MADGIILFGKLKSLYITQTFAAIELEGEPEKLTLWNDVDTVLPDRVTQSMWVSLCREALIHGNSLDVTLEDLNSSHVYAIKMGPGT